MLDLAIRGTKFIWIKLDLPIITMGVAKMKDVFNKRNSARKSTIITKKYSLILASYALFSTYLECFLLSMFFFNSQASKSVTSSLSLVALFSPFMILIKS